MNPSKRNNPPVADDQPHTKSNTGRHRLVALTAALLAAAAVLYESPAAMLVAATDGLVAAAIVAVATGAGLWLVRATGNGRLPLRWQIGLAAALGLGLLSVSVLMGGLQGMLSRPFWLAVMVLLGLAGVAAAARTVRGMIVPDRFPAGSRQTLKADRAEPNRLVWLWLLIAVPAALGILVASIPPGLLWAEEGNGYDVLEYHLGVPKEYYLAGRITYLDHNVYSNFPMNAEMLYLLCMVLYGSPWSAALAAKFVNLALAALTVYAAWLTGREFSPTAGTLAAVATACWGWLGYLSGVAYVENGMLACGMLAAALCVRCMRRPEEVGWPAALGVGLLVGLACGYKYTAVPFLAVPLLGLFAVIAVSRRPRRYSTALTAVMAAAVAFCPWAAKNWQFTGDPVFPLGWPVFKSRVWNAQQHRYFLESHRPLPQERSLSARAAGLWGRVLAEPRFGYLAFAAAGLASVLAAGRLPNRREVLAWTAVLCWQMAVWLFGTHLYARFAVVMWVPLVALLAAACGQWLQKNRTLRTVAVCGVMLFAGISQMWLIRQYLFHTRPGGVRLPVHGQTQWFLYGQFPGYEHLAVINGKLPTAAKLLMVGDARVYYVGRKCDYNVVFSPNAFAEAVRQCEARPGAILQWLRSKGYTHVWADFAEMYRLRKTYGFPAEITPRLFSRLEAAGLRRLKSVRLGNDGPIYGIVYEVPQP